MAKQQKVTPDRYEEIRDLFNAGHRQADIAKMFNCSRSLISDICCFRTPDGDPATASKMQQLADAKRFARTRLREGLRNEDIIRYCGEIAAEQTRPLKPVATPKLPAKSKQLKQETAVLVLSDGHHDQVVTPEEVGGFECYNFNVSLRRAEVLVDAVRRFTQQILTGYSFDRIVVLSLGDHTSGEIHDAERRSAFGNQFKNCTAIGALHAAIYRDLAATFAKVDVYGVSGNHGRRTDSKEYAGGPHNNWDYMVNKVAEAYLGDQPNVTFHLPDAWETVVDVRGWGFNISHGDDVPSSGGNPWNGLQGRHSRNAGIHRGRRTGTDSGKSVRNGRLGSGGRSSKPFCHGDEVDYYVIGHHHTRGIVSGNGVGYLCNGSWPATDQYAYNKMGVCGPPEQLFFGVSEKRGITWQLDGRDHEKNCRYDHVLNVVDGLEQSLNAPRIKYS